MGKCNEIYWLFNNFCYFSIFLLQNSKAGDFKSFISTEPGFGNIDLKNGEPFIDIVFGNIDI